MSHSNPTPHPGCTMISVTTNWNPLREYQPFLTALADYGMDVVRSVESFLFARAQFGTIEVYSLEASDLAEARERAYHEGSTRLHFPVTLHYTTGNPVAGGLLIEIERTPDGYRAPYVGIHT